MSPTDDIGSSNFFYACIKRYLQTLRKVANVDHGPTQDHVLPSMTESGGLAQQSTVK